jgi:hypothetical protein
MYIQLEVLCTNENSRGWNETREISPQVFLDIYFILFLIQKFKDKNALLLWKSNSKQKPTNGRLIN